MVASLGPTTDTRVNSVEDLIVEAVLPWHLKQPERYIDFRVMNAKTRIMIPRETFVLVFEVLVLRHDLFPNDRPLIIHGEAKEERYQLSYICPASDLTTNQAKTLKIYRNTVAEVRSNQP